MLSNTLRSRSTFILFAALILPTIDVQAQSPRRLISKLDAPLSASVRARHSDTKRVIIRTTPDGIPRLTDRLKANGHSIRRVHAAIDALTAEVPAGAIEGLSQLPFVQSISTDAMVRAEQTS